LPGPCGEGDSEERRWASVRKQFHEHEKRHGKSKLSDGATVSDRRPLKAVEPSQDRGGVGKAGVSGLLFCLSAKKRDGEEQARY